MCYEYKRFNQFTVDIGGWFEIPTSPWREGSHGLDEKTVQKYIEDGERPQIHIVRDVNVPPESDVKIGHEPDAACLPEELLTLAHEYGHAVSAQRGCRSAELVAALAVEYVDWATKLTDDQRALIFADEERAWDFGWEALAGLGYRDRDSYDKRRAVSLADFRVRLPLPLK